MRTREKLMSSALSVPLLVTATISLWLVANSPLFAILYRYGSDFRGFWIVFTSSPNRYLFSLLFMPMSLFAAVAAWRLVSRYAASAGLAPDHLLHFFTAPATVALLSLGVCSIITLWDYAAGDHNIADLRRPYAVASLRARDVLLAGEASLTRVELTADEVALSVEAAADACLRGSVSKERAARFLGEVITQEPRFADALLVHTNLLNVFVFGLVAWLTAYLLAVLALAKQGATSGDPALFALAKHMLFFSLANLALWVSLRAYELHEYRAFTGRESGESLDLLLGAVVVFSGCLFAGFAFETPVAEILGMVSIPAALVVGNVVATSTVRNWYGTAMTFPNFLIIAVIWGLLLATLYFVFFKGRA